jgi:hypothetical protein
MGAFLRGAWRGLVLGAIFLGMMSVATGADDSGKNLPSEKTSDVSSGTPNSKDPREINIEDKTIYPGWGLQKVGIGDSVTKLRDVLGSPSRERTFKSGTVRWDYRDLDVVFFMNNQTIREIHFNRGYQGCTPDGIGTESLLDDVLKKCGGALKMVQSDQKQAEQQQLGGDRVLYEVKPASDAVVTSYKFVDHRHGINYWFGKNKKLTYITVYDSPYVAARKETSDCFIVRFKGAVGQNPNTAEKLLGLFNDKHPQQATTHHFRAQIKDQEFIGYICADTLSEKDVLKSELRENKKIRVLQIKQANPKQLEKVYVMETSSEVLTATTTSAPATTQAAEAENSIDRKYAVAMKQQAFRAGVIWLKLLDRGQWEQGWSQSAQVLRKASACEKWTETIKSSREPLGKVLSRKTVCKEYTTTQPGSSEGEYVVIEFETSFENKKVVETVTPVKEKDGNWRVSNYIIK